MDVGDQKFISRSSVALGFMYRLLDEDGFGIRLCSLSDSSSCDSARCENRLDRIHDAEPFLSAAAAAAADDDDDDDNDDSSTNGAVKYGFLRIDRGDPGGELMGLAGSDLLLRRFDSVDGGGATANISSGPDARPLYIVRLRPDTI